jgi:organic radical activating enzyme
MKDKRYRINEIFLSVQGEGPHVGSPAVFIRFYGCNQACDFCDTPQVYQGSRTADEIVAQASVLVQHRFNFIHCVLTGGEPFLQVDAELVQKLSSAGFRVSIETNASEKLTEATKDYERIYTLLSKSSVLVYLVASPKNLDTSSLILQHANCLKLLYPIPFDEHLVAELITRCGVRDSRSLELVLQPVAVSNRFPWAWKSECLEAFSFVMKRWIHYKEQWRIIPQTHKYMGLR